MAKVKFEDKIKELETIINELESGNTSLEESIDKYTKAMKLAKECDEELKMVTQKVSQLVLDDNSVTDLNIDNSSI